MERCRLSKSDVFRFESEYVGTNMYLILSGTRALIVDPHPSEEADALLEKSGVRDVTILLTHEHPDHTNGVPSLRERFDTTLICQEKCARTIASEKNNRPFLISFVLAQRDERDGTHLAEKFAATVRPYACHADKTFEREMDMEWEGRRLYFRYTPGHSKGSCCILLDDEALFTGDSLIYGTPVITRFPGGSVREYDTETKPFLEAVPDGMVLLPGHGKIFKMEEIRHVGF